MKFDIVKFFTREFLGSNNLFPLINIMYFLVFVWWGGFVDEVVLVGSWLSYVVRVRGRCFGGCCEFWGGRCEVGDVTMCWEMIGLCVWRQFVCVVCVVLFLIELGINKFLGWVMRDFWDLSWGVWWCVGESVLVDLAVCLRLSGGVISLGW